MVWSFVGRNAGVCLLLQLGFAINLAESSLALFRVMTHLNTFIYALAGIVNLTLGKIQEISRVSQSLLADGFISTGHFQRVVGHRAACNATVPLYLFQFRLISSHL